MSKKYTLRLYLTGRTPSSERSLEQLEEILSDKLEGAYTLEVVDILAHPQLAEEDKIMATPTVARLLPPPIRRIVGDLSDQEKVLLGLDLKARQ